MPVACYKGMVVTWTRDGMEYHARVPVLRDFDHGPITDDVVDDRAGRELERVEAAIDAETAMQLISSQSTRMAAAVELWNGCGLTLKRTGMCLGIGVERTRQVLANGLAIAAGRKRMKPHAHRLS